MSFAPFRAAQTCHRCDLAPSCVANHQWLVPMRQRFSRLVNIDILICVGVSFHQRRGMGAERHAVPVAGDAGISRGVVRLAPAGGDRYPLGLAGLAVVDEDVALAVGVILQQVAGKGSESIVAS